MGSIQLIEVTSHITFEFAASAASRVSCKRIGRWGADDHLLWTSRPAEWPETCDRLIYFRTVWDSRPTRLWPALIRSALPRKAMAVKRV